MLKCAYMIFTKNATISGITRQVSAEEFFSHLSIKEAGTTPFNFVIGVWGILAGKKEAFELQIIDPNGNSYSGKWTSNESRDEVIVQNVIFNCSSIPLVTEGNYTFLVKNSGHEIGRRLLKVSIGKSGEETYE